MPQTPNHGYNVPNEGEQDWHVPLNENFEQYDTDIEIRDTDANKGNYNPKMGAKFLATDTETVYVGDGTAWNALESTGRDPDVDSLTASGQVAAGDIDVGSGTVFSDVVIANDVSAGAGITTPSLNDSGDNLGIGTGSPATPLDIRGGNNWNLDNGDGDIRIGNGDYRLAIGVALGGGGAGTVNMRAKGGTNKINLGGGSTNVLTVDGSDQAIGIGTTTPGGSGQHGVGLHIKRQEPTLSLDASPGERGVIEFVEDGTLRSVIEYDGGSGVQIIRNLDVSNYVDVGGDLTVSGNKNFVQPVETDDGEKEVVYTSTEAPTPQTEASGVAELDGGQAVIELPDHFGWVTDEGEPIHVQTTPYSADSSGLAVVERSTDRLVVEDLDGEGDYEFSYTIRGTREGHADKEVVREPSSQEAEGTVTAPADD